MESLYQQIFRYIVCIGSTIDEIAERAAYLDLDTSLCIGSTLAANRISFRLADLDTSLCIGSTSSTAAREEIEGLFRYIRMYRLYLSSLVVR